MLNKNQLHQLTPTELLFLEKHIKLGKGHLEDLLNQDEIRELFELAAIPRDVNTELKVDAPEVAGQVSLVLNTIMTATLGAWMGMSGFIGLNIGSKPVFISVLSFALIVGGFVGFLSAYLTKKRSSQVLDKRKLQDLEIAILAELNSKRKEELQEKTEHLLAILKRLHIHQSPKEVEKSEDVQENCLKWVTSLRHQPGLQAPLYAELETMEKSFHQKVRKEEKKSEQTKKFDQIVDKLSHASIQPPVILKSWIKLNMGNLVVGLIPTLFGGFSSLFVYLGGAPQLAQKMGHEGLFQLLILPEAKLAQFIFALLLTTYFAFSFIYLNRKAFKRDQELSKIQVYITREENATDVLDDRLLKLKEELHLAEHLDALFRFSKDFS